ncbi:S9 family peptidase [Sphingomonas sp. CGMCC 1.13654]|uniref:S9 family peptidase n=2 Tax=Sphingomonas chungangi TaxID=2683589 RepID=A0A838L6J1_9SPHN|nr:S9 family peptidase [Sphingomonas chungangi]MVW54219.1 alpha/beta fold hydrolase [Sphingomonas chungangi]
MRTRACRRALLTGMTALLLSQAAGAEKPNKQNVSTTAGDDLAADFGAREAISGARLSPDGQQVLYLAADKGRATELMVANSNAQGDPHVALLADGKPMRIQWCDWSDDKRIVCLVYLVTTSAGPRLPFTRLIAIDPDGKNLKSLAEQSGPYTLRMSQFDGSIIDWNQGQTGKLLMERDHVPERTTGTLLASTADGLGVDLVDTHTLQSSTVEQASPTASEYISDGRGVVRMMGSETQSVGMLTGGERYYYRRPGSRRWESFSNVADNGPGLRPQVVDPVEDVAYCFDRKGGRDALYKVALDGSMTTTLVYADPNVDVDDIVRLGRQAKLIGVSTVDEKRSTVYFDKEYEALATALQKALGDKAISFVSSSVDEQTLLLFAGSDTDPGGWYVFDRKTKHLNQIALVRPQLEGMTLATEQPITYRAADGTMIPAYLTLPPGGARKGLPAIVMPHGGPSDRDEWGFDWLPQYFAMRGYAVIQPNYRGSSGYGDTWSLNQGFKSWKIAISDVTDAGRWLVAQGIAAPDKLAIVGWSYGGYAALQSNVVAPDLFKATVAIAPVTDFDALKAEAVNYTNANLVAQEIGAGAIAQDASPARHADAFKSPVLMFHGTEDLNVNIAESRLMNDRLRAAGKQTGLIVYPDLDHQLPSGEIRADMLRRADTFLRQSMHIGG